MSGMCPKVSVRDTAGSGSDRGRRGLLEGVGRARNKHGGGKGIKSVGPGS